MSLKYRYIIKALGFVLVLLILYSFLFWKLHPFNPWVIGFDRLITNRAIIYYHKSNVDVTCLSDIDSLINQVEEFHKLKFKGKVELVISSDRNEHNKYNVINGPFLAYPFTDRIYTFYREDLFKKERNTLRAFLKHELSHSVIFQNISVSKMKNYPRWFLEGIATYSSGTVGIHGHPTYGTVIKRISQGCFIQPSDWGTLSNPARGISLQKYPYNDVNLFAYSEFAYIIEKLVEKYGKPKFEELVYLTLEDKTFENAFKSVYNLEFEQYIKTTIICKQQTKMTRAQNI